MKKHISATNYSRIRMFLLIFRGVLVNVLPAYMANSLGLPLFLDTIGTIAASALGGIFPGILVGMLTNVICMIFDPNAIYFGSINALTAVFAGLFVYKYSFRRVRKTVIFVVCLGFFVGVTTAVIHWFLLGGSQRAVIADISDYFKGITGMPAFWTFLITNILLNVLDKGITTLVVCLFMIILPQKFIENFGNSGWKQRPLTDAELKSIREWGKKLKFSLRVRMTLTLIAITIVLVIVTGWIGTRLYYDNEKLEKTENVLNAVKFAADVIDAEKVNDYLKYGRDAKGYEETEQLLAGIKKSVTDAKYLYVLKVEEDGCYVVFDVETEDTPAYQPGEKIEFEEAFYPYIDALLRGEEIEPIDSDDISGWVRTVYYPVKKENGRTVCYACADVSLMYMADYMKLFIGGIH